MRYFTCHGTLLWPWFRDFPMHFQVVGLLLPILTALCLKDSQIRDDIIYPELLPAVGVIRWNKLPWYWQLKNKKTLH